MKAVTKTILPCIAEVVGITTNWIHKGSCGPEFSITWHWVVRFNVSEASHFKKCIVEQRISLNLHTILSPCSLSIFVLFSYLVFIHSLLSLNPPVEILESPILHSINPDHCSIMSLQKSHCSIRWIKEPSCWMKFFY